MPYCAVQSCKNHNRNTAGKGISYHSFPKNSQLQKLWEIKCKRSDPINFQNARICSDHFKPDDYKRDLKAELLNIPPNKRLKEEAVPSINLPGSSISFSVSNNAQQSFSPDDRTERCRQRAVRKRALDNIACVSPKKRKVDKAVATETELFTDAEVNEMKKRIQQLEAQNCSLKAECVKLKARNRCLTKAVSGAQQCLKKIASKRNTDVTAEVENILAPLFTKNQIRCLKTGQKRTKWGEEDICRAITLRAVSRKAYMFLRNKMQYPLPGISTIRRWIRSSFQCRAGLLKDVMQVMKTEAERLTAEERLCVLSFDEMNVDSRRSYDQEEDRVVGPHSNVQVVMARGLVRKWKQPIFYDFDVKMTATLLKTIISALVDSGYTVVAVVSDLGPKNASVWNELGVSHTNSCFPNPTNPKKRVWVFADVPHLYKLLRNHFLDDGLTLPGNKKVSKETIQQLLTLDSGEIKMCTKLSLQHLAVKGRDRQRVFLAVQLFSNATAQAIRKLIPGEAHTADFFQLINDTFDILNSRKPISEKPLASGYGINEAAQGAKLRQLYTCIEGMRVGTSRSLKPFQKGFLTSIRSLLGLFNDMKALKVDYILTARLNQDCLENFFSLIRGIGHFYDHPLPTEVKYRLRLLLIGANAASIPLSGASPVTEDDGDSTFITSELFGGILPSMSDALAMLDGDAEINDVLLDDPTTISPITERYTRDTASSDICTAEGLRYLSGYIAFKCRKYDNSLGTPTGQLLSLEKPNGWIEVLSRGGLLVPSDSWHLKVQQFELIFAQINGPHSLSKDHNIIKTLCKRIQEKFNDVPAEVIKVYARTRTFIRMRHLNAKAKQEKLVLSAAQKAKKWEA